MPKIKTNRSAAKRFKVTGTGKLKRNKAYRRHILTKKTTKNKRNLRHATIIDESNEKNMKKINTKEEYREAMKELDRREFYANMSDDYSVTCREMDEINRERHEITTEAHKKNLL